MSGRLLLQCLHFFFQFSIFLHIVHIQLLQVTEFFLKHFQLIFYIILLLPKLIFLLFRIITWSLTDRGVFTYKIRIWREAIVMMQDWWSFKCLIKINVYRGLFFIWVELKMSIQSIPSLTTALLMLLIGTTYNFEFFVELLIFWIDDFYFITSLFKYFAKLLFRFFLFSNFIFLILYNSMKMFDIVL